MPSEAYNEMQNKLQDGLRIPGEASEEDNVSDQVKAAGLTPREFFEFVVEHNPVLITDEYEFKTGKTYLLPQCQ